MAKLRTKKAGWDTTVKETESGGWTWENEGRVWTFTPGMGVNLRVRVGDQAEQGVAYFQTLDAALMFAYGYEAGAHAIRRGPDPA